VTLNQEQAISFGNVASSYDRVRPEPPPDALDWLVPAGCEVAVDLAAGTGLFTRALLRRAARVVAVEPDQRMREVLAQRSPGVDLRAGWGEAMPLPDASADAVFVSTAWHWLDPARAVPEIARVLRPGGRLGVIWTSRDRGEDWVAELDLVRVPGTYGAGTDSGEPRTAADVRARLDRHHTVTLPAGAAFRDQEAASFRFIRTISVDDVLEWLATSSEVITAAAADRTAGLARCRAALTARADHAGLLAMPMRSWCWRAQRWLPSGTGNHEKRVGRGLAGRCKPYHFRVGTEFGGGAHGDGPWHAAQPPYHGGQDYAGMPAYGSRGQERHSAPGRGYRIGVTALVIGLVGLVVSLYGVATQLMPRHFSAVQQRQITNWEYAKRWRELPADQIFPAQVKYAPPSALDDDQSLTLAAHRVGIARQASCKSATDAAAAAVLDRNGCTALLRATYTDGTDSYVVTVGAAVLPGSAQAANAARELAAAGGAGGLAPGVHAVAFKNTPAAWFTDQRRQLSGSLVAGGYLILFTVGYADSRPREPVSGDTYADAEMTNAGLGVAHAVLSVLGAPVPAAHCPGAPGC